MSGCPVRMDYDWRAKQYVAIQKGTGGIIHRAQTLKQYEEYTKSIGCTEIQYPRGTSFTPTGFLEFAPRDPATQAKYDATYPQWEGPEASQSAITKGLFDLDFAKGRTK